MDGFFSENRFSVHSNSKGNLLKTEYKKDGLLHFVKTGRMQLRDYPGFWGIEPVIEVICSRLGKALNLNMADYTLHVLSGKRYGKEIVTFVCDSPDFRNGKSLVYLQTLYIQNNEYLDFEKLCRLTDGTDLVNMLAFDLIIMNEDRHNGNAAWLLNDDGSLESTPIFDNGYALLYDDIKGMLTDFRKASAFCLCNSPLYAESFREAERLFCKLSSIYEPTVNFNASPSVIHDIITATKQEYDILLYENVNNVQIPKQWWSRVEEFINWRIEYVGALRYNMER
ncbi:MAG: hypothetical protein ACI38A_04960 [Candidatus Ornithomonoglobus sp.]